MVKVKICGLSRPEDIGAANEALPDYVGFMFAESRRRITPERAASLREKLSSEIVPVGVFVNERRDVIVRLVKAGVIEAVQLHGGEDEDYIVKLKELTNAPIIKAVNVNPTVHCPLSTVHCAARADFLMFDGARSGAGEAFDWRLVGEPGRPFFLAGGLNAGNVASAIAAVSPFAVDVSSGVETDGLKNREKIISFVKIVRGLK